MHAYLDRKKLEAPRPDQAEISIFGNGQGEAILVHFGANEWAIFDSCLNPKTQRPAPLEYLEQLEVNPAEAVKLFLVSHWHSDHIKGGAELFRRCVAASFTCSIFFTCPQMLKLVDPDFHSYHLSLPVKEFAEIIKEVENRESRPEKRSSPSRVWAAANRKLLSLGPSSLRTFSAEIFSLSPADEETTRFLSEIAKLLEQVNSANSEIIHHVPNDWSVVVWISIGAWDLLLGGDLEQVGNRVRGWNAILLSREKPKGKARIFKVPHHGSSNAHHPKVWEEMVSAQAIALLTPFDCGKTIPTDGDISRLCSLTPNCYCAALTDPLQPKPRSPVIDRQLNEMAREPRKAIGRKFGQVRVRFNPLDTDDCEIALIDQAYHLCEGDRP